VVAYIRTQAYTSLPIQVKTQGIVRLGSSAGESTGGKRGRVVARDALGHRRWLPQKTGSEHHLARITGAKIKKNICMRVLNLFMPLTHVYLIMRGGW